MPGSLAVPIPRRWQGSQAWSRAGRLRRTGHVGSLRMLAEQAGRPGQRGHGSHCGGEAVDPASPRVPVRTDFLAYGLRWLPPAGAQHVSVSRRPKRDPTSNPMRGDESSRYFGLARSNSATVTRSMCAHLWSCGEPLRCFQKHGGRWGRVRLWTMPASRSASHQRQDL